jgi:hypothetical protein
MQDPRWPVLVTTGNAPLHWRDDRPTRLWLSGSGRACLDNACAIELTRKWHAYRLPAGDHTLRLSGIGTAMEFRVPYGSANAASSAGVAAPETPLRVVVSNRSFGFFGIALPPHRAGWLVLREGWSPAWRMIGGEVPITQLPALVDGYASGWRIPELHRRTMIFVVDVVSIPYVFLLAICWITWMLLFTSAIRSADVIQQLKLRIALPQRTSMT